MQWSDVTKAPSVKTLRQFSGLLLIFLCGLAAWRAWDTGPDEGVAALAVAGVGLGLLGLVFPAAIRVVYTTWMVVAFPIGWTMSRLILAAMFYLVFTPVALVFRLMGRDVLRVRKIGAASYWTAKPGATDAKQYLRQF